MVIQSLILVGLSIKRLDFEYLVSSVTQFGLLSAGIM